METIGVSEEVKAQLESLRDDKGHTSFDSAIRELLLIRDYTTHDGQQYQVGGSDE